MGLLWEVNEIHKHQIKCYVLNIWGKYAWRRFHENIRGMNGWRNSWVSLLGTLCLILSPPFCSDSFFSPSTQGPLIESWVGSLPPDVATLSLGEEEELHYASLSFHGTDTWGQQEQVPTGTEYSEIKIHKWEPAETQPWLGGSWLLRGKEKVSLIPVELKGLQAMSCKYTALEHRLKEHRL